MIYTYTTSPDEDAALAAKLAAYNEGLDKPVTTQEFITLMTIAPFMAALVDNYERSQIEKLAPLGAKYLAAPADVKEAVDAQLAPFDK